MRQFLSFSLAAILISTSANAYTPEQLPEQIEAAILLNEDGTHRCRIGQAPELDSLRECDESDELYARTILDAEDISLGIALSPGRVIGVGLAEIGIMGVSGCIFNHWADIHNKSFVNSILLTFFGITLASIPAAAVTRKILAEFATTRLFRFMLGASGGVSFYFSTHCNNSNDTTDNE